MKLMQFNVWHPWEARRKEENYVSASHEFYSDEKNITHY